MIRVPPPALAFAAGLAQRALTRSSARPNAGRAVLAMAVSLASTSIAGAAARQFRLSGTTLEPIHPDHASALVTTGANSISRNPMYVGLTGLLVANAIRRGSWVALVPVAGFVLLIDRQQIEAEESALLQKFGTQYQDYRAATPRWLGRRSLGVANP